MVERDVIGHLIDVERQASDIAAVARDEAAKRLKAARGLADAEFRSACEDLEREFDGKLMAANAECDASLQAEFDAFNARLESTRLETGACNALLDGFFAPAR